jgi:hypothetical protein
MLPTERIGHLNSRKMLRREGRDRLEHRAPFARKRISDPEIAAIVQTHHIPGPRFFNRLPLLSEELLGRGESQSLAGPCVRHLKPRLKPPGADARKGNPIPVLGIHIGLNLEHKCREGRIGRCDLSPLDGARRRRRCIHQEPTQEGLDTEIRERTSKKGGRDLPGMKPLKIKRAPDGVQKLNLFPKPTRRRLAQQFGDGWVLERSHLRPEPAGAMVPPFVKQVDLSVPAIVHAQKLRPIRHGPGDGTAGNPKLRLHIIQKLERRHAETIAFVHKGEDGDPPEPAHLEQLPGLLFHALPVIEEHDGSIRRHQGSIRVFRKVLVARRIEQIDAVAIIVKLEYGGGHRNATFPLHFHPVRRRVACRTAGLHRSGQMDGAAIKQELLRQRGLPGVRMGNDGKGTPPLNFKGQCLGIHLGEPRYLKQRLKGRKLGFRGFNLIDFAAMTWPLRCLSSPGPVPRSLPALVSLSSKHDRFLRSGGRWAGAFVLLSGLGLACGNAQAQTPQAAWNTPEALGLLARGQAARLETVNDGTLTSYEALTEGHIYFYVDTEDGEQALIRVDQVAVELYWQAPDLVRQRIVGERSETRLPVRDFRYYLDRLTLVQYGFEDEIQVGQGMDVANVPHPLAPPPAGDPARYPYDVQLGEAVTLRLPGEPEPLAVRELRVRPRDPSLPGFVGSVFLSERDAQVVRMSFTFTPASYVDRRTDWIRVSLDYGLWEGRYWLPNRQELEVRRELPELDLGIGTVIRAVLRVGGYDLNTEIPASIFMAPPVTQFPREMRAAFAFQEGLYGAMERDGLGQIQLDVDPRRLREEATRLMANRPATGLAPLRLHIPDFSSLIRADPYQGITVGAGASWRPQGTLRLRGRAGASVTTGRPEGSILLDGLRYGDRPVSITGALNEGMDRSARSAGPGLLTTIGTLAVGESFRSPWRRSGILVETRFEPARGALLYLTGGVARHQAESLIWTTPPWGPDRKENRPPPEVREGVVAELGAGIAIVQAAPLALPGRLNLRLGTRALLDGEDAALQIRGEAGWTFRTEDQGGELALTLDGGTVAGESFPQLHATLGGPGTLPGLPFAARVSPHWGLFTLEGSQELGTPWVRARAGIDAGWADDGNGLSTGIRGGVGLVYDILRIEGARVVSGWGTEHGWRLVIGVHPLWWPYL